MSFLCVFAQREEKKKKLCSGSSCQQSSSKLNFQSGTRLNTAGLESTCTTRPTAQSPIQQILPGCWYDLPVWAQCWLLWLLLCRIRQQEGYHRWWVKLTLLCSSMSMCVCLHNRCRLHFHNKAAARLNAPLLVQRMDGNSRARDKDRRSGQEEDSATVGLKSDSSSFFPQKMHNSFWVSLIIGANIST